MSVATELTRIQTAKADIKTAIEAKGVQVPSNALIDTYDTYIGQISGGATKTYFVEGVEYDQTVTGTGNFINAQLLKFIKNIIIPSGYTSIWNRLFQDAINLESVTIPDTITEIQHGVFSGCTSLTRVNSNINGECIIPNNVTTIGAYSTINNGAFQGCTGLTSITLPNTLITIGYQTFYNCTGLTSVTIGNSVTEIGAGAFYGCTGLTSVTLPSSVIRIGGSSNNGAFKGCTGLTDITIPSGVTYISLFAFNGCTSLTSVTCLATTPPTLGIQAFDDTNNCPIYVPTESVAAYQAANNWSSYASRIQAIPS